MYFMNEWEIDSKKEQYEDHPILGPATRLLSDLRDLVNNNSDGWSYWKAGINSAKKLMTLIDDAGKDFGRREGLVTIEQVKKAMTPIKSFCTRHNLKCPELR